MPDVRSSGAASGTVTMSSSPSKDSARPKRPALLRVAPPSAPSLPPLSSTIVGAGGLLEAVGRDRVRGAAADGLAPRAGGLVPPSPSSAVTSTSMVSPGVAVAGLGQVERAAGGARRWPCRCGTTGSGSSRRRRRRRRSRWARRTRCRRSTGDVGLTLTVPGGRRRVGHGGRGRGGVARAAARIGGGHLDRIASPRSPLPGLREVERGGRGARDGGAVAEPPVAVGERVAVRIAEAGSAWPSASGSSSATPARAPRCPRPAWRSSR